MHNRFHDLGEPRRGMRRHHDLFHQDVQIHRNVSTSLNRNVGIEANWS